jgi:hypothetical protein
MSDRHPFVQPADGTSFCAVCNRSQSAHMSMRPPGGIIPLYDGPVAYSPNGSPQHPSPDEVRNDPWSQLTLGRPTGKRVVMPYEATGGVQIAPIEFFTLGGLDRDAVQMQIVLSSPMAIPRTQSSLAGQNIQNLSGEYGNSGTLGDYPGSVDPIKWPPVSTLIEWGTNSRAHAFVDAKNGAVINLTASWVRAIGIFTADHANQPGTSGLYVMSAFASPGWPSAANAQRTIYLGSVASLAQSDVFTVPPFARRATVIGMDTTPGVTTAYLLFWQSPDGTNPIGTYFVSGNNPGPFSVPNGAAYFTVVSGAGSTIKYAAAFDLF